VPNAQPPRKRVTFYRSPAGNALVLDELAGLPPIARRKLSARLALFAEGDARVRAEKVEAGLFEIKGRADNLQPRALVTISGDHDEEIVVLHCWLKKSGRLDEAAKQRARGRLAELSGRIRDA
jgi:phage-related protein